jgi:general secretion pathway protein D
MPEQDFELYLSLLSRFLRLKPAQRDEIADELRDHLEERLEELAARGLTRGEAIKAALDEFGDAAELAQHFTHVAHIRRRRLIMRYTFGTVAALAASLLIAAAFWPESPQAPAPMRAVAQGPGRPREPQKPGGISVAEEDSGKVAVEAKLAKQVGPIEFMDMPISEVLEYLGDQIDVDILIDPVEAEATNAVYLKVKRAKLTARVALDLVLEPLNLGYTIRDGLIKVTTAAQANQIQVYNVRDLVESSQFDGASAPGMSMGGTPGMSGMRGRGGMGDMMKGMPAMMGALPPGAAGKKAAGHGAGGGAMMGGLGRGMGGPIVRHTESLAEVIATTIDPDSWDSQGGNGSVVQYHELLVVKNSQTVHGKIKALLEMMRTSARGEPGASAPAAVPGGPGGAVK